jgi:hypothetical protein
MTTIFAPTNLKVTLVEALITAIAAALALLGGLAIWAMFVGWIAYFTRGLDGRNGFINLACVIIGLTMGVATASILGLVGAPGIPAQAAVVFGLGIVVLSMRFLPLVNNLLGFFLGLVAWFASHQPPNVDGFVALAAAATLGTTAGWMAHSAQKILMRSPVAPAPQVN